MYVVTDRKFIFSSGTIPKRAREAEEGMGESSVRGSRGGEEAQ